MAIDVDAPDSRLGDVPVGAATDVDHDDDREPLTPASDQNSTQPRSGVRAALVLGVAILISLSTVGGWLGYRAYQLHQDQQRRSLFLQVARQGALNLTTIDYTSADADVQRIVDSSTGTFHDDFQKRAQPFVDVVRKAQSKSQGAITEAGVQSEQGDQAQVIVAVTVNTSIAGVPEGQPRAWRMRITVQMDGDSGKVANVEFVP